MWRVLILLATFVIAPTFAPYDPLATNPARAFEAPSLQHLFGTDQLGRDVLSRTLYGGRTTLGITLTATILCLGVGFIWLLLVSGDEHSSTLVFRIVIITNNALRSLPLILIAITGITILENNTTTLIICISTAQIPSFIHWLTERIQETKKQSYIEGAKAIGATKLRISRDHMYPSIAPELKTQALLIFQQTLITTSALTFLGFGLSTETTEWGNLLREGREAFRIAPWISTAPGLCITILCATILHQTTNRQTITTQQSKYPD